MKFTFLKGKEIHFADWIFANILKLFALGLVLLLGAIGLFLFRVAQPAIQTFGWSFLFQERWDPVHQVYGALPVIYGTLVSSAIALIVAAPLSVGAALFLTELAPKGISKPLGFLIEMLAAVPSVIYGLWGIFVLAPWFRTTAEPFLNRWFGFLPFFRGPYYGVGLLAAGVILAIMITPTIFSVSREIFQSVPLAQREAALALGATRWETLQIAVIQYSKNGVAGAILLGLGRALGETMAVTMVIGNRAEISSSLFAPSQTMASAIANEYAEALGDLHLAAVVEVGLILFVVSVMMNALARATLFRNQP